jgi:hypothetical protein
MLLFLNCRVFVDVKMSFAVYNFVIMEKLATGNQVY